MRVTAMKVGPPKSGHGPWWAKVGPDSFVSFDPQKFDIKERGSYDIELRETEKGGRVYRDVIMCKPAVNGASSAAPSASTAPDRWWLPMCSNLCAHAIQAGLVKNPSDIKMWAAATKQALMEIDRVESRSERDERNPPADDEIPY